MHGTVACTMKPLIVSPLMVLCSAKGKKCLVINLNYLNQFVQKEKFRYEDVRTLLQVAKQGDGLVAFDLRSRYHHIDIHSDSQTFLGFCWEGKYYKFTVLPFGLSSACFVLTKVMCLLVKYGDVGSDLY